MATTKATKAKGATATAAEAAAADKDAGTTGGALATQGSQELGAADDLDYGEDSKKGYENQDQSDRKIPMLFIVQSNSPQVKDRKALPGQWFNSITQEAYDTVELVPALTDHVFIEWRDRDAGGGYRGRHQKNAQIVTDAMKRAGKQIGKLPVPQPSIIVDGKEKQQPDHELSETFEIAAVLYQAWRDGEKVYTGDLPEMPVVVPCKSTMIKAYKEFSTNVGMFQLVKKDPTTGKDRKHGVPLFAHRIRLRTKEQKNNKGEFYVPVIEPAEGDIPKSLIKPNDPRYVAAKQLHEQYLKGLVRGDYESQTSDESNPTAAAAGGEGGVPF